ERLQVHRAAPDELEVGQHVGRLVEAEVHPVVLVPQQQFAAVAVVAVHYIDPRLPEVRQAEQEPLLDLLELPRLNYILPRLFLERVAEKTVPNAEFRRQKRVDEGDVVVDAAHLEDLLTP